MTKQQLSEILQPLIKKLVKESVQEILLKEGFLSKIISEVVSGLGVSGGSGGSNLANTTRQQLKESQQLTEQQRDQRIQEKLEEQRLARKKMLDAIGLQAMDGSAATVFDGTAPLKTVGTERKGRLNESSVPLPTAGLDPDDPGVNIEKLLGGIKFDVGNKKMKLGE
jgi:hypothetical protein